MRTKNPHRFELIEEFINNYKERYQKSPAMQEIADGTGISKTMVLSYIKAMKADGRLDYEGVRSLITKKEQKTRHKVTGVPVVGDIACGLPLLAEQNIEEYVDLPESWIGSGQFFALHANGDSMEDIGINNGDIVIIRQQETAEPGQVIVALVDESSATLKRYYPRLEEQVVELRPENDAFETQIIDLRERAFAIQGIAVKVLKDI